MRIVHTSIAAALLVSPVALMAQTAAPGAPATGSAPATAPHTTAVPGATAGTAAATTTAAAAATPATGPSAKVELAPDGKVALKAGTPVQDPKGGTVGWIESTTGGTPAQPEQVVLKTRASRVTVTGTSFARTDKAAVIGMTEAEVDKAAAGTAAATPAAGAGAAAATTTNGG